MKAAIGVTSGTWILDAPASTASFTAHQMWLTVPGTVPFRNATVEIGPDGDIVRGHAELHLAGIMTGNERRERDLAKPGLLDLAHHPLLIVQIGRARRGSSGWTAAATLTARGAVVPCALEVTVVNLVHEETGDVARCTVTTTLDLAPLRMKAPRFAIGHRVEVRADAAFRRVDQPPR